MGDAVLKVVAQRLQGIIRGSDVVARLGGDESVLLTDMSPGAALETAQRMVQLRRSPMLGWACLCLPV